MLSGFVHSGKGIVVLPESICLFHTENSEEAGLARIAALLSRPSVFYVQELEKLTSI